MDLEARIRKLEDKVALLVSISDCDTYPFVCVCLDADLDITQMDRILVLISKVENSMIVGNPISYTQFEAELHAIVPSKKGDSEFAKSIVRALNKENKFILVSKKFEEEGVNF